MHRRENYLPLIRIAFLLTIAIVVTFQIYQLREPSRLTADAASDKQVAEDLGGVLYSANCASCHGEDGEGVVAPGLNSKSLLADISDDQLFGLTRTGVPGTGMPAWSQDFGGPLTDEQVRELVVFIRSWEPGLDEIALPVHLADPDLGAALFESICAVCHGLKGTGTDRAPAINNDELLTNFDDEWFKETIIQGRPSKGMPTWGTILSPAQIDDVVALIAAWREGEHFEQDTSDAINAEETYATNCAACHGAEGEGGFGSALRGSETIIAQSDQGLLNLILNGRAGTAMPGFSAQLGESEIAALVELLRSWQP